jgi:hypothetical protein
VTLGARELPRHEFLRQVADLVDQPSLPSRWQLDADLPDRVAAAATPGGHTDR